jgi:hypothetical protein
MIWRLRFPLLERARTALWPVPLISAAIGLGAGMAA